MVFKPCLTRPACSFTPLLELKMGKEEVVPPSSQTKCAIRANWKPIRLPKEARRLHQGPPGTSPDGTTLLDNCQSVQNSSIMPATNPHSTVKAGVLPAEQQRNTRSRSHAARIDALLRKYLGSEVMTPSESTTVGEIQQGGPTGPGTDGPEALARGTPLTTRGSSIPIPGLKRIVQVKTEQDTALRALRNGNGPRLFRAKPLPLTLLRKVGVGNAGSTVRANSAMVKQEAKAPQESGNETLQPFKATPVPRSTSEPLYALMAAASQLKQYGQVPEGYQRQDASVVATMVPTAAELEAATLVKCPSTARAHPLHSLAGIAEDPLETNICQLKSSFSPNGIESQMTI